MATNFPTSVDVLTNPVSNDSLNSPSHSAQHANANDAIEAIETYSLQGFNYAEFLHIEDNKAAGTNAGTFTLGALRTRDLNTIKTNTITGASLSANRITLPAGTYFFQASTPAYKVDFHKNYLVAIAPVSGVQLYGTSELTGTGVDVTTSSVLNGTVTFAATQTIELQHLCTATRATDGFGRAFGASGGPEVYSYIKIWKVG